MTETISDPTLGDLEFVDKYIVLKTEDLASFTKAERQKVEALALDSGTFFVIREQDVFGPQALYGYCHLIQSSLEVDSLPGRATFNSPERSRLSRLADYLHTLAGRWARSPKKVPD